MRGDAGYVLDEGLLRSLRRTGPGAQESRVTAFDPKRTLDSPADLVYLSARG